MRGSVKSLGADCEKKEMRPEHIEILKKLLEEAECDAKPEEFTRYGSLFLNKGKLESTQPAKTFFLEPISHNARRFIAGDIVE